LPTDAEAWRYQGLSLGMSGNLARAVDSLTQASALDPQDALSRRMRGRYLLALKRPADAGIALEAALRLDPKDAESRAMLIQALREQGKPFQALALWWRGSR
jgi:tetratricopeptide (TPR) repeat protein